MWGVMLLGPPTELTSLVSDPSALPGQIPLQQICLFVGTGQGLSITLVKLLALAAQEQPCAASSAQAAAEKGVVMVHDISTVLRDRTNFTICPMPKYDAGRTLKRQQRASHNVAVLHCVFSFFGHLLRQ